MKEMNKQMKEITHNNCDISTAVYPGTFDPITFGHLDVIERACKLFDKVIVGVAAVNSSDKKTLFNLDERIELCKKAVQHNPKVEVLPVMGLTVDFVRELGANVVVRGLRAVSDFDYEFKMNLVTNRLAPETETIFLMANENNQFISSSFVREIATLGGDISSFVPSVVIEAMVDKLNNK